MTRLIPAGFLAGALLSATLAAAPLPSEMFKFDIQERSASRALQSLADATGLRIVYGSNDLFGVSVNPVQGEMNYEMALRRMLAGTGLSYRAGSVPGEIIIVPRFR